MGSCFAAIIRRADLQDVKMRSGFSQRLSMREIVRGFRLLEIEPAAPILVHASLPVIGAVNGGANTVLGALLAVWKSIAMPVFTYKTMLIPETGPQDNALNYGMAIEHNRYADFFTPEMPADPLMGEIAEVFRRQTSVSRSEHPVLSFAAINLDEALHTQTQEEPLGLIEALYELQSWVLLVGMDQTRNFSLHLAEKKIGRKQFMRWALTPEGVAHCPNFPGCAQGFYQAATLLKPIERSLRIGGAQVKAYPLKSMIDRVHQHLLVHPTDLLCSREGCELCASVRQSLEKD